MGKQHFTKHAYVETGPLPTCCWREVQTPTPRMSLMRPPCITLVRGVWLRLCTLWCNAEEIWRLWTKMENLQLTMQPRLGVCKNCFSLKHQGKNIKIIFFCPPPNGVASLGHASWLRKIKLIYHNCNV